MNGVYMITAFFPAFSVSVGLSVRITPLCRCPLCVVKLYPLLSQVVSFASFVPRVFTHGKGFSPRDFDCREIVRESRLDRLPYIYHHAFLSGTKFTATIPGRRTHFLSPYTVIPQSPFSLPL